MNAPDDAIFRVLDWAWAAILALLSILWKGQDSRIKDIERRQVHDTEALFNKLDEHGKRSEERHLQLLTALHDGLNKKVDK